jgi:hypothetical protein
MGRATLVLVFGGGWRSVRQSLLPQLGTLAFLLVTVLLSGPRFDAADVAVGRVWLLYLSCYGLLTGPAYLPRPSHSARLYLFGVDYRRQFRFNLAVCCLSPVLPLAAAAALLGGAGADGLAVVAVAGGVVLLHAGWVEGPAPLIDLTARPLLVYLWLPFYLGFIMCLPLIAIAAPLAVFSHLWWVAGGLAALGLASIAYRLWADDEAKLRRLLGAGGALSFSAAWQRR